MTANQSKEQQKKKNEKNLSTKAALGNPKLTGPDRPAT